MAPSAGYKRFGRDLIAFLAARPDTVFTDRQLATHMSVEPEQIRKSMYYLVKTKRTPGVKMVTDRSWKFTPVYQADPPPIVEAESAVETFTMIGKTATGESLVKDVAGRIYKLVRV